MDKQTKHLQDGNAHKTGLLYHDSWSVAPRTSKLEIVQGTSIAVTRGAAAEEMDRCNIEGMVQCNIEETAWWDVEDLMIERIVEVNALKEGVDVDGCLSC
jgi:hypothetical protein